MKDRATVTAITRVGRGAPHADADLITVESPLRVDLTQPDRPTHLTLGLLMRTPGHDNELVTGLLVGESVLRDAGDLIDVTLTTVDDLDVARVRLAASLDLDERVHPRSLAMSSACGLCGRLELQAAGTRRTPAAAPLVPASVLAALPGRLRSGQPVFDQTGGLHAAGLFALDGSPLWLAEDIGRHNAVDKVIGMAWRARRLPDADLLLAVSGRVAFEIVQKAAMAGVGAIAAIGAPSSLAVEAARAAGLILVGFARDERANVYAGSHRIR